MKTKITKNRITALILAILLSLTILSPTLPVIAQETTTDGAGTTQNNGGTSAGAGDKLPTDTTGDNTDTPTITTNPDGTRTLKFSQSVYSSSDDGKFFLNYTDTFTVVGAGKFVIIGYYHSIEANDHMDFQSYLLSDKPFAGDWLRKSNNNDTISTSTYHLISSSYKGINYTAISGAYSSYLNKNCYTHGFVNERKTDYKNFEDALKADIDNGRIDLSVDNYKEPSETSAVYNKALDFASISADYKVKYTIEKNKDGHFEFITPDDAGIQFDWINRTDIDGAYVKFTLYGEYYDSFWSTTYTNTYVTLTCDRKNDLTYLCKQKDMLLQAKEKCNGSKGYGFVVNYIYVQAFAKIDGTLCRSRIYKFDSDLVSDYGNADSEDDEWFPEITGGDSMPEEYEPDPENPDPEKTEPKPDKDDDTVVDTPIDNDPDVIINDDVTYLEAFKQFINVMKQGISYLGDFPALVAKVFSFIPPIFILFIGIGFAVALLLRFLGR